MGMKIDLFVGVMLVTVAGDRLSDMIFIPPLYYS